MSRRITTTFTITSVLVAAPVLGLAACRSEIDHDWTRIDDLDEKVRRIEPLDAAGGVGAIVEQPAPAPPDLAHVESLLAVLTTGAPQPIELPQVRKATIDNNLALQSVLLQPEIAEQRLLAERAKFESTFEASVTRRHVVDPTFFGDTTLDVETDVLEVTPGLRIPLQTGGSVALDWSVGTENNSVALGEQGFATSQPGVRLRQPLLRGAGVEYNEASIVIAGGRAGAVRAQTQAAVLDEVVRSEVAYWQLHRAWNVLKIDLDLYRMSRELLDTQRRLVERGAGSVANVFNFEVAVATAVERVVDAEQALHRAVRALKVVMQVPGMSLDSSVSLRPDTEPVLVGFELDRKRLVTTALGNRADLLQLEFEQLTRTVEVFMRERDMLPTLDVQAAWNANGFVPGASIADANTALWNGEDPNGWSVGLSASIPLGNEAAIANHQAAVLARLAAIADRRQREITVTQEVLDAADEIQAAWDALVAAEFRVKAAERYYDAYQTLFDRGQIPSSNLTQALQALGTARIQQATLVVRYQIALAGLAQATGCLLGHASIEWDDALDTARLAAPAGSDPSEGIPDGTSGETSDAGPSLLDMLDQESAAPTSATAAESAAAAPASDGSTGSDG